MKRLLHIPKNILYGFMVVLTACNAHHALECDGKGREFQEAVLNGIKEKNTEALMEMIGKYDTFDADASCVNHRTALQEAVFHGHVKMVRTLAKITENIDKPTPDGDTALIMAVSGRKTKIVRALLSRGANPALENNYGDTAISIAKKYPKEHEIYKLVVPSE